jgi:hypothetical protein
MKKFLFVLLLLIPVYAVADRKSDFINQEIEKTHIVDARINAYAVNQEKLDIYRTAHPRYNFPKNIKDLKEKQAEQILSYFWDNYRFSDYKYDEIQEKVWDMMIHMSMSDLEKRINECIRKYYEFDDNFYAQFGSVASVGLLNGMAPKHIPDFYLILDEVKY